MAYQLAGTASYWGGEASGSGTIDWWLLCSTPIGSWPFRWTNWCGPTGLTAHLFQPMNSVTRLTEKQSPNRTGGWCRREFSLAKVNATFTHYYGYTETLHDGQAVAETLPCKYCLFSSPNAPQGLMANELVHSGRVA